MGDYSLYCACVTVVFVLMGRTVSLGDAYGRCLCCCCCDDHHAYRAAGSMVHSVRCKKQKTKNKTKKRKQRKENQERYNKSLYLFQTHSKNVRYIYIMAAALGSTTRQYAQCIFSQTDILVLLATVRSIDIVVLLATVQCLKRKKSQGVCPQGAGSAMHCSYANRGQKNKCAAQKYKWH